MQKSLFVLAAMALLALVAVFAVASQNEFGATARSLLRNRDRKFFNIPSDHVFRTG